MPFGKFRAIAILQEPQVCEKSKKNSYGLSGFVNIYKLPRSLEPTELYTDWRHRTQNI